MDKATRSTWILEHYRVAVSPSVYRKKNARMHAPCPLMWTAAVSTCDLDFLCNGCLSSSGTCEELKEDSSASVY